MAAPNRKPFLDRATALLAGPFLLGQRALGITFRREEDSPPGAPPDATTPRISITPPEHAIKRRG